MVRSVKRPATVVLVVLLAVGLLAGAIWLFQSTARVGDAAPPVSGPETSAELPGIPPDAFELTVESVHDGDTLRARIATPNEIVTDTASTRIRLIGVDTPEISPDLECWGAEATARLTELLPLGSTVWATPDRDVLDRYDRHLLYLWTPDGRFVNGELIAAGDATVMIFAPNDEHEGLFRELEAEASAAGRGLWGACD